MKFSYQREGILNGGSANTNELSNIDEIIKELKTYEHEFDY